MKGVVASIDLTALAPTDPAERICIMFNNPDIFLHGTRGQMREFARQIAEKAER